MDLMTILQRFPSQGTHYPQNVQEYLDQTSDSLAQIWLQIIHPHHDSNKTPNWVQPWISYPEVALRQGPKSNSELKMQLWLQMGIWACYEHHQESLFQAQILGPDREIPQYQALPIHPEGLLFLSEDQFHELVYSLLWKLGQSFESKFSWSQWPIEWIITLSDPQYVHQQQTKDHIQVLLESLQNLDFDTFPGFLREEWRYLLEQVK